MGGGCSGDGFFQFILKAACDLDRCSLRPGSPTSCFTLVGCWAVGLQGSGGNVGGNESQPASLSVRDVEFEVAAWLVTGRLAGCTRPLCFSRYRLTVYAEAGAGVGVGAAVCACRWPTGPSVQALKRRPLAACRRLKESNPTCNGAVCDASGEAAPAPAPAPALRLSRRAGGDAALVALQLRDHPICACCACSFTLPGRSLLARSSFSS